MRRAPKPSPEGAAAARAAIKARLPHFAGCPDYLAETADVVVVAYISAAAKAAQHDLWEAC